MDLKLQFLKGYTKHSLGKDKGQYLFEGKHLLRFLSSGKGEIIHAGKAKLCTYLELGTVYLDFMTDSNGQVERTELPRRT